MQDITNSIKVLVRQHKQEQGERLGSSALNRLKSSAGKVIENNRFSQFVPMGLRGHKLAGRLGEVGGMIEAVALLENQMLRSWQAAV